jgi:integrase
MAKVKLTAGRIAAFVCEEGKTQAFLWCAEVPGLGVRATLGSNDKRYIFQSKVNGKTMRVTIGRVKAWSIPDAQIEARRLQMLIDKDNDPRQVKVEQEAVKEIKEKENAQRAMLESVTAMMAWSEYVAERTPLWSALHLRDHQRAVRVGGLKRKRSKKVTESGTLLSLMSLRLVNLTQDKIEEWARIEGATRSTQARLALRLLKAFLFWCSKHPVYKFIIKENPAQSKKARESLGKAKAKNDVLQREQLKKWFDAVKQINNSVISAYLQALLLTGARREELAMLRYEDVDFQWNSLTIRDKVEGQRIIPLTPYVSWLLSALPKRNEWVFSSLTSSSGRITDPNIAHAKACTVAGLYVSLHGLRRSFASLCEWTEVPAGIAAQIQGHAPQGVREQNYIRRPLDLLRKWHVKFEAWILEEAEIQFDQSATKLRMVIG